MKLLYSSSLTTHNRLGFNGMEKDNEVKGDGNSYTTHFRQLDSRLGRWLSIDPKATAFESPFVSMGNNPISNNDVLGDSIKTDKKGWDAIKGSLDATLQKSNPFKFNDKLGTIDFDKNVDISKLDKNQKEIVDNFKSLVVDEKFNVELEVIPNDFKFLYNKEETTLKEQIARGVTISDNNGLVRVYISNAPLLSNGKQEIQKEDEQGITVLHELGGHAYFYQQGIRGSENNKRTEQFERKARDVYKGKYIKNYIKSQEVQQHYH